MKHEQARNIAAGLRRASQPSLEWSQQRLEMAGSLQYWRALVPALSVGTTAPNVDIENDTTEKDVDRFRRDYASGGYFACDPLLSKRVLDSMRVGVENLRDDGWPPVFAYVYDQFWTSARTSAVRKIVAAILGDAFHQTVNVWVHYVAQKRGTTGWSPHADNPGLPGRLTLWLSLSDSTLENGCIYLLPKDRLPARITENFVVDRSAVVTRADVHSMLHASTALPVRAGALLGWDGNVVHWGSAYRAGEARMSISMQFIARDADPMDYEMPLLPLDTLPPFERRMAAIGRAILDYQDNEPQARYIDLAKKILDRFG